MIKEFEIEINNAAPYGIAAGDDGSFMVYCKQRQYDLRMTKLGGITQYPSIPNAGL